MRAAARTGLHSSRPARGEGCREEVEAVEAAAATVASEAGAAAVAEVVARREGE